MSGLPPLASERHGECYIHMTFVLSVSLLLSETSRFNPVGCKVFQGPFLLSQRQRTLIHN